MCRSRHALPHAWQHRGLPPPAAAASPPLPQAASGPDATHPSCSHLSHDASTLSAALVCLSLPLPLLLPCFHAHFLLIAQNSGAAPS